MESGTGGSWGAGELQRLTRWGRGHRGAGKIQGSGTTLFTTNKEFPVSGWGQLMQLLAVVLFQRFSTLGWGPRAARECRCAGNGGTGDGCGNR